MAGVKVILEDDLNKIDQSLAAFMETVRQLTRAFGFRCFLTIPKSLFSGAVKYFTGSVALPFIIIEMSVLPITLLSIFFLPKLATAPY